MNEIKKDIEIMGMDDFENDLKKVYQKEILPDNRIIHRFFTSGHIGDDESWVIALQHELVKHHKPNDIIELYINCYGGCIRTTAMLLSLLDRVDCIKVAYVSGVCMSGGSVIALGVNWNELYIDARTSFLFHSAWGGVFGKTKDMLDNIQHLDEWVKFIYKDAYKFVLTSKEINEIVNGKELYLLGDEVSRRIIEYRKKEEKLRKERELRNKKTTKNSTKAKLAKTIKEEMEKIDKEAK